VTPGELGQNELHEFIDEVGDEPPESAAKWRVEFLPRGKVIYSFPLLSGAADVHNGWSGVHSLQDYARRTVQRL
jgi:hypothetical protein